MSENNIIYTNSVPVTVEAFRNRPCSLAPHDENFVPPTAEEVKSLRTNVLAFTQIEVARLVGDKFTTSGAQSVQSWERKNKPKAISNSSWILMLLKAKVIKLDDI